MTMNLLLDAYHDYVAFVIVSLVLSILVLIKFFQIAKNVNDIRINLIGMMGNIEYNI